MLLPIGLDETRLARLPWVSIVIAVLCALALVWTSTTGNEAEVGARVEAVVEYWSQRPYLELPRSFEQRTGVTRERLARIARIDLPEAGGSDAEREQLGALCDELFAAMDAAPERAWSLVPARGARQPGWLTHLFLHGGLGHLLGNMLVFILVVGPFLEDAWGRPFFLGFYLLGGLVAGAAQALPMGDSQTHILGASGAISACLGAFALRFAHRRVRIFYWFFLFIRGSFFVPAWGYAFFALAMDLWGLRLAGTGGGVAYAAHVGGFFFGLAVAVAVRASGLEDRIAPEGAARWGRSLAASRASDALARGASGEAEGHYRVALGKDGTDQEAILGLARIAAERFDRETATPLFERVFMARIGAGDAAGAGALLRELGAAIDPRALRPATAYRAAELALGADRALADRLDEAASSWGGALGGKALARLAERTLAGDPARAAELAEQALALDGVPPEIRARAEQVLAAARPPVPAVVEPAGGALASLLADDPVQVVECRLVGASERGLHVMTPTGKPSLLPPSRVAAVAAGLVQQHGEGEARRRNAVLLDVLLAPRPGETRRTVVRLPGHGMALAEIHPGVPAPEAYGRVVERLLAHGAPAAPSPEQAAGRPFESHPDAAAFERASWGRRLGP